MANVLITGNGYDLSKGLPTHYMDFIKILNYISSNNDFSFEKIYSLISNKEFLFKYYSSFDLDMEKIVTIKTNIANNFWYHYFSTELNIDTWIDFETQIEYLLEILIKGIEDITENIFNAGSVWDIDRKYSSDQIFNNDYEKIYILQNSGIIYGPSVHYFKLQKEYLIQKRNYYTGVNLDAIATFLIDELNSFIDIFNLYFIIFVLPLYDNINNINMEQSKFRNIDYHFTFNYTPTFEKIELNDKKIKTQYIHGKIDFIKNNIVLGIKDISDSVFDRKEFIPFTKFFQKINNSTYYKFITAFKRFRKKEIHQFFFYGHSLDISDEFYINEIFEFVLSNENNRIIIIYHNETSKSKLLQNIIHIIDNKNIQKLIDNDQLDFINIESKRIESIINDRNYSNKYHLI